MCVESSDGEQNCHHICLHIYYLLSSFIVILPDGKRWKHKNNFLLGNIEPKINSTDFLICKQFYHYGFLEVLSSKRAKKSLALFNAHEAIRNSKTRKRLNIIRPTPKSDTDPPHNIDSVCIRHTLSRGKAVRKLYLTLISPRNSLIISHK